MEPNDPKKPSSQEFSQLMKTLEALINRLENGELSLEEAIRVFEEGILIAAEGKKRLAEAEKRVSILLTGATGEALEPFRKGEEADSEISL